MKTFKTFVLISIITVSATQSAFASWWNPFTWFQKKTIGVSQRQEKGALLAPTLQNTPMQALGSNTENPPTTEPGNMSSSSEIIASEITVIEEKNISESKKIKCNIRNFDAKSFKEKPWCTPDMSPEDTKRELAALEILRSEKQNQVKFKYPYDLNHLALEISNKNFVLMRGGMGVGFMFIVVDLKNKKVSDYIKLNPGEIIQIDSKRIVYAQYSQGYSTTSLSQYVYGTEKSVIIKDSEISEPKTYMSGYSPEGNGIRPLATSTDSITLGVYDKTITTEKPEIYWTAYKQVELKTIRFK